MENNTTAKALAKDWEADISAYTALLQEGNLTLLERAAIAVLIEKAHQRLELI